VVSKGDGSDDEVDTGFCPPQPLMMNKNVKSKTDKTLCFIRYLQIDPDVFYLMIFRLVSTDKL